MLHLIFQMIHFFSHLTFSYDSFFTVDFVQNSAILTRGPSLDSFLFTCDFYYSYIRTFPPTCFRVILRFICSILFVIHLWCHFHVFIFHVKFFFHDSFITFDSFFRMHVFSHVIVFYISYFHIFYFHTHHGPPPTWFSCTMSTWSHIVHVMSCAHLLFRAGSGHNRRKHAVQLFHTHIITCEEKKTVITHDPVRFAGFVQFTLVIFFPALHTSSVQFSSVSMFITKSCWITDGQML